MTAVPDPSVTFKIKPLVYKGLTRMAAARDVATGRMAFMLFDAAYTTRCAPTGDQALDKAVAAMDAPQTGDAMLLAKLKEQAAALEEAISDRKALAVANTEVANLCGEIKRLKGADKQLADALGKLDKMAAEIRALKAAAADREATEIADRMLKEATDKMDAANTEVANLSAEVKALKDKAEADNREISTLTAGLMSATRAREILEQKPNEHSEAPKSRTLKIVAPSTPLGAFLATWVAEAGQVAA